MTGYSLEEVLGKTPRMVQGPKTDRATLDKVRAALKVWQPVEVELINYHKDGSEFWVELSIVPVADHRGWYTHWVSLQRDITERKRTEERLRLLESVVVNANDAVLITEAEPIDEPGPRIVYANEAFTRMTGYSLEEVLGKTPRILQGPKTERATLDKLRAALTVWQPMILELINYRQDGSEFWVEMSIVPVTDQSGGYTHWVSIKRDITERKAAEALRKSEERYALAVRGANDGLWDWNLIANKVYFSARWKSMLGYFENEIGNSPNDWFNRVHPEDTKQVRAEITAHIEGLTPYFENEHRMLSKDGTYRWMLSRGTAVRDADGKAYRIVGSQTNITDRRIAESQLLHNAFHDALTGLPNRALFVDCLSRAVERGKRREDYLFAVLFLDLDRFKVVNDSLGHSIGDQLLIAIACRLEACLRPKDTAARLGGDEFTILLEDIEQVRDASRVAERIQEELTLPFELSGQEVFTTASIGIVLSTSGYDQPEDLLRDADIAMYRAKALGKARYEIFNPDMHTRAVARLQLETALRHAFERQELRIHYQPIVSLESGRLTGFEP